MDLIIGIAYSLSIDTRRASVTTTDTQILAITLAQLEAMLTYRAPAFDAGTSVEVLTKPTSMSVTRMAA